MKICRKLNTYKGKLSKLYAGPAPKIHKKTSFSCMSDFPVRNRDSRFLLFGLGTSEFARDLNIGFLVKNRVCIYIYIYIYVYIYIYTPPDKSRILKYDQTYEKWHRLSHRKFAFVIMSTQSICVYTHNMYIHKYVIYVYIYTNT